MSDNVSDRRQTRHLANHEERLTQIEQAVYRQAATPGGALQRLLLSIPTAAARLALGARGSRNAVGPDGIALATDANLAAQVGANSILDGDGNVIVHSAQQAQLLSQGDAAISSNARLKIGTVGSIEITAGHGLRGP